MMLPAAAALTCAETREQQQPDDQPEPVAGPTEDGSGPDNVDMASDGELSTPEAKGSNIAPGQSRRVYRPFRV